MLSADADGVCPAGQHERSRASTQCRGGLSIKIRLTVDTFGNPIALQLTGRGGWRHQGRSLLPNLAASLLSADRDDKTRRNLRAAVTSPPQPSCSTDDTP
jgi:hypothetical protein